MNQKNTSNSDNFIFKLIDKAGAEMNDKPLIFIGLILVLCLGIIPQFIDFARQTADYNQKKLQGQANKFLDEAYQAYLDGKTNEAIKIYQEAIEADPKNVQANAELATLYLLQDDFAKAAKPLRLALKEAPRNTYVVGAKGILDFKRGRYQEAEKYLRAVYKNGLRKEWIIDYLGASLIRKKNADDAFDLAGWNGDCQSNTVSHAFCMKRLAEWHGVVAETEYRLADELKGKNKEKRLIDGIYHQRRQIIFLGESLRAFFRGIEENDGKFRLSLIDLYEAQKKKLNDIHNRYTLIIKIHGEKIQNTQLTKGEKGNPPI